MLGDEIGRRTLVADGAMGTQLQMAGLPIGHGSERWTLEHPDAVEAIHRAYVAAGCDIVVTNSFGAHRWALAAAGLEARLDEVNRAAGELARRAAGSGRYVLGDIGPSGQLLEPLGPLSPADLRRDVSRRAAALVSAGVDGVLCETMTDLDEAVTCVEAAIDAGAPVVVASMAFDKTPGGRYRTMMGVTPEAAGRRLREAGATVVGANCGVRLSVADFAVLATILREASGLPVMIQPNAGQPVLDGGRAVYQLTPEAFGREMAAVIDAGAAIVGGCCGTTPAHIAALCAALRPASLRAAPDKSLPE
jgi:5-methyltetrahydrofolate--homocysteine methyltransferase